VTARSRRDPLSIDVMDSLVQTSFTVVALLSRVAAENDLSLTQLRVLAILRDRTPTMTELATHLGLERSSVSGLVDRGVRRGIVRRDSSVDDGRAVRVGLTPVGERLAALLTDKVAVLLAPLASGLSLAEQRRLGALLKRLLA
jgi:DNA-binding MarR family transcriptional regulator